MRAIVLLSLVWLGCSRTRHPLEEAADVLARPNMIPETAAQELTTLGFTEVDMKRSSDGEVRLVQLGLGQTASMADLEALFGAPSVPPRGKGGQQFIFTPKTAKNAVGVSYVVKPIGDAPMEEVWARRAVPLD